MPTKFDNGTMYFANGVEIKPLDVTESIEFDDNSAPVVKSLIGKEATFTATIKLPWYFRFRLWLHNVKWRFSMKCAIRKIQKRYSKWEKKLK